MTYSLSIKDWANGYAQITISDDCIWMQYTGLKDKNRTEIYEGDIVRVDWNDNRYKPVICEVQWVNETASWSFGAGSTAEVNWSHEIIGNIHENPELLK